MADGSIKIDIEVDGKQISVASKELDRLEDSGHKSGKGIKATESSMDSLSDKSSKAGSSVKGASGAIDDLGDSGSKAGKGLKGTDGAIDDLADSSAKASSSVKGAGDAIEDLGDSGSKASKDVKGAESSVDSLSDSSSSATSNVKGTSDSLDSLGDSGSKASNDLKGADGAIDGLTDSSAEASKGVKGTSDSLDNMGGSADNAADATRRAAQETENVGDESGRASMSIKDIAVSLGLVAVAAAAFSVLKSSLDGAISRFDTLAGFPVVMERMGFSSEEAGDSIKKLSDGIQGLPTTLDGIVASTQRIAILTGDLDTATDTALALNNAFLASGASAGDAERGLTQYVQMLSKGSVDIMSWRTLQETMGYALKETAKEFGYTGESAQNDLYDALKGGEIVFKDFNAKLIELNEGVGGFADMAATGSAGIATSFGNLKTAVVVGVANTLNSFDKLSQATTGKTIAQNLDGLKAVVSASFKVIGSVIEGAAPVVIAFASAVQATTPVVKALSPAIIGLVTAYASYMVITKVTAAIAASNAVLVIAQASSTALTVATRAQIAATVAQTGAVTLSTLAIGVLTGKVTLSTVVQIAAAAATTAWGVAIKFLLGPVGLVISGIAILVTGIIALVKWFNRSTEEGEKLTVQTDSLATSTETLSTAVEESSKAFEKSQQNLETSAQAYAELAVKVEELAAKENKSAEEKKQLTSYVDELNRSVDGLNLVYGKQSEALNMTSEEMTNRINLMKEEEGMLASQERLTELIKEEIDIGLQLKEVNLLREESNQLYKDGDITRKEHKETVKGLEEQEVALSEAHTKAGEERVNVEQQIIESSNAVAAAAEEDMGKQLLLFDALPKELQKTVESMKSSWDDYASAATDMFDTISTKSEVSVSKMTKNLEENQRIITQWSENIAKLAERGIDEGLLNTLREAGPESAGHVNALVKASDTELTKLSDAFAKGGDVATDALSKSLGIEKSGVMEAVGHLVVNTEQALADQIKGAGFEVVGEAVPEGLAKGIEGGSKEAENASKKMSDDTTKAAKQALDVNSPSGVFKTIGTNITEGLVLGINGGSAAVIAAIQKMFRSVQTESSNSFTVITKDYDNAVIGIEKSLEKLPIATQKAMKNALDKLKESAKSQIDAMKTLSKDYDAAVKDIEKVLNKLPVMAQKSMSDMLTRLNTGANSQVKVMRALAIDLIGPFKNTPSQLQTIGNQAMAGFNRGLVAGESQVMATARRIASSAAATMRKELDIHSPSRVFMAIGRFIVDGLTSGITDGKRKSEKAMQDVSRALIEVAENHASTITKIDTDARIDRWKIHTDGVAKEKDLETKAADSIQKIKKTASDKIQKLASDETKKIQDIQKAASNKNRKLTSDESRKIQDIRKTASDSRRKLTVDESDRIQAIQKDLSAKLQKLESDNHNKVESINKKARAEKVKTEEGLAKQRLDAIKNYIADKKSLEELDLVTEVRIWEQSISQFEESTRERIEAQNAYKNAVEAVNKEIETINKDHFDKIKKINDDLANNEKQLNEEYNKAFSDRVKDITNVAGLFDEFVASMDKSGQDLIKNLQSQVTGLEDWRSTLDSLWDKIDDDNLMKELEAMGPKALGELQALNSLSATELDKYSELYRKKTAIAVDQATHELSGLKEKTENNITEMRNAANAELDKVEKEWVAKIESITEATDTELKTLKSVGRQAGEGLLQGLASIEPALIAKATSIANSIKKAMQSALDINSPSGVMKKDVGRWIPEGIALGIKDNAKSVYRELDNLSRGMILTSTPEQALGTSRMAYNGWGNGGSGNSSISHDNRKSFSPQITNHFTPAESTPSEHTRQQERLMQRMAMDF